MVCDRLLITHLSRSVTKRLSRSGGCDGTSRHLCSLSLLCRCALDWFSLFLSLSLLSHSLPCAWLLIIIIILLLVGYYIFWFFLPSSHSFFFLTALINHLYIHFCTPILYSSSSSCSSFYSINSWVSFIHYSPYYHFIIRQITVVPRISSSCY